MTTWNSLPYELKKGIICCVVHSTLPSACLAFGPDCLTECQSQLFSSVYIDNLLTLELISRSYAGNEPLKLHLRSLHVDCAALLRKGDGELVLESISEVFRGSFELRHFTISSYFLRLGTAESVRRGYERALWCMMKRVGLLLKPSHIVIERCVFHPAQLYHLFGALPGQLQYLAVRDIRDQPLLTDLPITSPTPLHIDTLVLEHIMCSTLDMLALHTRHGSLGTVHLSKCLPRATESSFSFYVARLWEDGNGPRNLTWWLPVWETKWAVGDLRSGSRGLAEHLETLTLIVEGEKGNWAFVWNRNCLYWELFEVETMRQFETESPTLENFDTNRALRVFGEDEVFSYKLR
ncbi:hypothetical protein K435DRAFT_799653 [Dendrothele bispora CBS 962.96]|uniref:Uncharacterized protein n=1 Tax=Dendrothele bispora (strain CBS 962.96) TaxID=1314807 RepID=A0A4S8LVD6_DENBC|nr:hypothetical protein K435DRAFT_799653 [Dendrothele bispora CBS 962.96]